MSALHVSEGHLKDIKHEEAQAAFFGQRLVAMHGEARWSLSSIECEARKAARHARNAQRLRRWLGMKETQRPTPRETFTEAQAAIAIDQILDFASSALCVMHHADGGIRACQLQHGYFSGDGWAARVLRYHLEQLRLSTSTTVFREED